MTAATNLIAGWIAILLGCLAGATEGLFFHREEWMGGYGSWPRRMMRLGHISFVALGFLNIAFAATFIAADLRWPRLVSALLIAGLCAMPAVCYLSAASRGLRHLFVFPATCVISSVCIVVWSLPWI